VNKEIYAFDRSETGYNYLFVSTGYSGNIRKMVSISPIRSSPAIFDTCVLFNLAFGDVMAINNQLRIDDSTRSNNGDMAKVLATVTQIAILFMKENPGASLIFEGYMDNKSTELGRNQRNILYQRVINSNWDELSSMFVIEGIIKNQRGEYLPGENYDAILITPK
jgi:hypothetical protein